jgi:hypothetical protein
MPDNFDEEAPHIFISYAHMDNVVPDHWVDTFADRLQAFVSVRWGTEAKVWKDHLQLQGNDPLPEKILSALQRAYVIVSVISPTYFKSPWCTTELHTFCEAKRSGSDVGLPLRVFKVFKLGVEATAMKVIPELVDTMGFPFYHYNGRKDVSVDPSEARADFDNLVDDVAIPVSQVLDKLLGGVGGLSRMSGIKIYHGRTGTDKAAERDRLRISLMLAGHTPVETDPVYDDQYDARVKAQLAACHLSIHPIGDNFARLENSDLPIDAHAYDLANDEAHARPEFLRISWRPSKLLPSDPHQAAFVERVRDDVQLANMEHIEDKREYFEQTLGDRLAAIRARMQAATAAAQPPTTTSAQPPTAATAARPRAAKVYLLFDPRRDGAEGTPGAATIAAIRAHLIAQKLTVVKPLADGSPDEVAEYHQLMLRQSDAVLIYHGNATPLWVAKSVAELTTAGRGFGTNGYAATAVLLAPPPSDEKTDYNDVDVPGITTSEPFDASALAPFLAALHGAVTTAV